MIWQDHVFNYGPKSATRVKKFREKHDLARLCFMLYTPSYGNSQLKMEILEFTSEEAAAPLMSLAAPLWFWKFREKNSEFGNFFPKFSKPQRGRQ